MLISLVGMVLSAVNNLWIHKEYCQLGGGAVNNIWIHRDDCQLMLL
jgi:hypothetical protein